MTEFELEVSEEDKNQFKRLDQFLAHHLKDHSRSYLKQLFESGQITSNVKLEIKKMPEMGTKILVTIPDPRPSEAIAQDIPLNILFEDEHLIIVNKEVGMVTHPAPGNYEGTLVNAILHHCPDLKGIGDVKRPGIVHRLDKGTSGVMVVAKNQKCHEGLVKLFAAHDIDRYYEALVMGKNIPAAGTLEAPIGRHPQNRLKMAINVRNAKKATTHFKVLEEFEKFSHVQLKLETGRTHQIRVHLSQLLHRAIMCDPLYGNPKQDCDRLGPDYLHIVKSYEYPFLHAKVLGFKHPITGEQLHFEAPPPVDFQKILDIARGSHE